jgi:hypothetical protein
MTSEARLIDRLCQVLLPVAPADFPKSGEAQGVAIPAQTNADLPMKNVFRSN